MLELTAVFLALAILAPLAGVRLINRGGDPRRIAVIAAIATSLALFAAALLPHGSGDWLTVGPLRAAPLLLFTGIILAMLLSASKADLQPIHCKAFLMCLAGALLAYSGDNILVVFAGWAVSAAPFITGRLSRDLFGNAPWHARPSLALIASVVAVGVVAVLVTITAGPLASLSNPAEFTALHTTTGAAALLFTTLAALIRNGIFPFHRWTLAAYESEAMLPYASLLNAQFGVVLLARVGLPLYPGAAAAALPYLSDLALFSALITAFMAFGTKRPRRILALIASSQSAFVISGLESRNLEGITGALLQWLVVSAATAGLVIVYRAVEVRTGGNLTPFAGIAEKAPRMAVFFVLIALSLVGLPGTLGFCAEDLLFHGALEAHPFLGIALPLATALNAIHLYRLFSTLFLGRRPSHVMPVADALPRERWCLSAIVAFLVVSGLAPQLLIPSRSESARSLIAVLGASSGEHMK
jgi:NADH-quinone oxidoreductase subunit M